MSYHSLAGTALTQSAIQPSVTTTTTSTASSPKAVLAFQQMLIQAGFWSGPADGSLKLMSDVRTKFALLCGLGRPDPLVVSAGEMKCATAMRDKAVLAAAGAKVVETAPVKTVALRPTTSPVPVPVPVPVQVAPPGVVDVSDQLPLAPPAVSDMTAEELARLNAQKDVAFLSQQEAALAAHYGPFGWFFNGDGSPAWKNIGLAALGVGVIYKVVLK